MLTVRHAAAGHHFSRTRLIARCSRATSRPYPKRSRTMASAIRRKERQATLWSRSTAPTNQPAENAAFSYRSSIVGLR